jgi:hypothetical protein
MSQEEVRRYAHEISTEWNKSVRAIISVADLISEAWRELIGEC